jgi:hypothetical protein
MTRVCPQVFNEYFNAAIAAIQSRVKRKGRRTDWSPHPTKDEVLLDLHSESSAARKSEETV